MYIVQLSLILNAAYYKNWNCHALLDDHIYEVLIHNMQNLYTVEYCVLLLFRYA